MAKLKKCYVATIHYEVTSDGAPYYRPYYRLAEERKWVTKTSVADGTAFDDELIKVTRVTVHLDKGKK